MYRKITSVGLVLGVGLACSAEFDDATPETLGQAKQALSGNFVPFSETPVAGQVSFASGEAVRAILPVYDRVYVGGNFSFKYNGTTYQNLVAFDIPSNASSPLQLVAGFNPRPNGTVNALASDHNDNLFVGGEFTKIGSNQATKLSLAALSMTSGQATGFRADVSGSLDDCVTCISGDPYCGGPGVKALSYIYSHLLVGGNFKYIKDNTGTNHARNGLAAIDPFDEIVDTDTFTQGVAGGFVTSIQLDLLYNTVYVGGTFQTIQGEPRSCMAAFWSDGTIKPPTFSELKCPAAIDKDRYWQVKDIAVDMMHARVYVAVGGKGTVGGSNPTNKVYGFKDLGATYLWKSSTLGGDAQAVDYFQNVVYVGTHDGVFKNGSGGKNGDPYKIFGLDLDTGGFLVDAAHQGKTCSSSRTGNCWLPVSDAAGTYSGFWGVADVAHYERDTPRLFAGGFISHFGNVANTKFFGAFSKVD